MLKSQSYLKSEYLKSEQGLLNAGGAGQTDDAKLCSR